MVKKKKKREREKYKAKGSGEPSYFSNFGLISSKSSYKRSLSLPLQSVMGWLPVELRAVTSAFEL